MCLLLFHPENWLLANKLTLHILKSEYMLVGSRQRIASLEVDFELTIINVSLSKVIKKQNVLDSKSMNTSHGKHILKALQKKVASSLAALKEN